MTQFDTHPLEFTFIHQIKIDRNDKIEVKQYNTQEFNLLRMYQALIPNE